MHRSLKLFPIFLIVFFGVAHALPAQKLVWEDLVPKFEDDLKDPMEALELYRRMEVETIIWAQALTEEQRQSPDYKDGIEDAAAFDKAFREEGIDTEKLVTDYKVWQSKVDEHNERVNTGLNGKQVKIAGYLIPLQFSETEQKEFLLVPYVGACIHAPTPPTNQIVFVELNQSFKSDDLYTAVWVTGTMKTKVSSKALSFVDGSADIPVGYTLSGSQVEAYTE